MAADPAVLAKVNVIGPFHSAFEAVQVPLPQMYAVAQYSALFENAKSGDLQSLASA